MNHPLLPHIFNLHIDINIIPINKYSIMCIRFPHPPTYLLPTTPTLEAESRQQSVSYKGKH